MDLRKWIRDVPGFPKPGIVFKDITPMLGNPEAMAHVEERLHEEFVGSGFTAVAGIESRGFIFGALLARRAKVAFVPIRKEGKLPAATIAESYSLEYGEATVEIHQDAVGPQDRVLIVDDLLATGGTAAATVRLVRRLGAEVVGVAFVVELAFLEGRNALAGERVVSLITYDPE
jgi:adenine phosphoribosyltransferase